MPNQALPRSPPKNGWVRTMYNKVTPRPAIIPLIPGVLLYRFLFAIIDIGQIDLIELLLLFVNIIQQAEAFFSELFDFHLFELLLLHIHSTLAFSSPS